MNPAIAAADIEEIAQTKNPRRRYFSPRRGISIQRHMRKLRPKSFWPSRPRYSETVPMGQSQLQKALRRRNEIARNVISRNMAAGWIAGTRPVNKKYLKFIRPAMGSQPSIPGGGAAIVEFAPFSSARTQK